MKASKFTEAQIAFVLKQAEDKIPSQRSAVRLAFRCAVLRFGSDVL